jgi:putative transposase
MAEKFLDAGLGESWLRTPVAARILCDYFGHLTEEGIQVPHYSVMPNHWHALIESREGQNIDLHAVISRIKGHTSRAINKVVGRIGPLWQREWFDHWIRDEAERKRCIAYIRMNPVKAGLVQNWTDHAWTR